MWRCGGRMSKSCLPVPKRNPILLDKKHYLATLVVTEAHRSVLHNGVKETLTELQSAYWLYGEDSLFRRLIHACVICCKFEVRHCRGIPPPPLPEFSCHSFSTISDNWSGFWRTLTCTVHAEHNMALPVYVLCNESCSPGLSA